MELLKSNYIISSRLTRLTTKDVIKILYLAEKKWNHIKIQDRMTRYQHTPIISIGISNPEELTQVKHNDIPVIHIQQDCQSLQALEKRLLKKIKLLNRIYLNLTTSVLGYALTKSFNILKLFKRGNDVIEVRVFNNGILTIPNYLVAMSMTTTTCLLAWITKRLTVKIRNEYNYTVTENQVIEYRSDVLDNTYSQYILPTMSCLVSMYFLNKRQFSHW